MDGKLDVVRETPRVSTNFVQEDELDISDCVLTSGCLVSGLTDRETVLRTHQQHVQRAARSGLNWPPYPCLFALTQRNVSTFVRYRDRVIPFMLVFSKAGETWL